MLDFLEIAAAVLAVYGGYMILDGIRFRLLFPRRIRRMLRAAVVYTDDASLADVVRYVHYLKIEGKISRERLIILGKDGIMEGQMFTDGVHQSENKDYECDRERSEDGK